MLWGQRINVYTDHKNLTRDGLGLTSDRVARWRILLEEYAPEIIYIKGIHNTVADAISRLDYDPKSPGFFLSRLLFWLRYQDLTSFTTVKN